MHAAWRGAMRVVRVSSSRRRRSRAGRQAASGSRLGWRQARPFLTAGARVATDIRLRQRRDFN